MPIPIAEQSPLPRKLRVRSLDQFRGYAVAGMIVVNFLGAYACTPRLLRHTNDHCSYADTIMPNFLFAVGFAIAIVWGRVSDGDAAGRRRVQWRLARRCLLLMLVAFLVYFPWGEKELSTRIGDADFWFSVWKRDWFQTLTHIACTTLWMLPVLNVPWRWRWTWLATGTLLHVILTEVFYFHWLHTAPGGIDGGPLGFLTWSISAFVGLWAGEAFLKANRDRSSAIIDANLGKRWLISACLMMVAGYSASCLTRRFDRSLPVDATANKLAGNPVVGREHPRNDPDFQAWHAYLAEPPFVPPPSSQYRAWNYWMMSQKAGSISYQVFAAGLSLLLFLMFQMVAERTGWEVGLFRTLGSNAIVCYIVHGYFNDWVGAWLNRDSSSLLVSMGLVIVLLLVYSLARLLEWRRIYIRL